MSLRIATITVSGTVTTIQDADAKELVFILETEDTKGNKITAMCKSYGKANREVIKLNKHVVLCGAPVYKDGALYVNVSSAFDPTSRFNYAMVGGHLGRDVDIKHGENYTLNKSSVSVTSGKNQTSWFNWVYFRDLMDWMPAALTKGAAIVVSGSFNFGSYKNTKTGKDMMSVDLNVDNLNFLPKSQGSQAASPAPAANDVDFGTTTTTPETAAAPVAATFDAIPF